MIIMTNIVPKLVSNQYLIIVGSVGGTVGAAVGRSALNRRLDEVGAEWGALPSRGKQRPGESKDPEKAKDPFQNFNCFEIFEIFHPQPP